MHTFPFSVCLTSPKLYPNLRAQSGQNRLCDSSPSSSANLFSRKWSSVKFVSCFKETFNTYVRGPVTKLAFGALINDVTQIGGGVTDYVTLVHKT